MRRFFLGASLVASCAWAQFTLRSNITGLVTDQSQSVIPNVTVVLTDLDRNQISKTQTNETGLYLFSNINPGRYQVSAEPPGFRKAMSAPMEVTAQQTVRVDLALEVGNVTQTVEVTSTVSALQTEQNEIGQTVQRALVEALPVKGRNFTAFSTLSPNISAYPRGNDSGTWNVGGHHLIGGVDIVAGGGGDNGFYMNGANINDNWVGGVSYAPSMEAISEVKVDVAGFSAANGRDISTVQVQTRGGGNDFHGTAFDYFQNSAMNAWNPFSKLTAAPDQKKSVLQRNQFGGNLGGPIVLPKIFNGRDKAFFFVNYEDTIERRGGASETYHVPTEANRQGDFSEYLTRFPGDPNYLLYDPFSTVIDANGQSIRTPIPNNDLRNIGASINPDAKAMLAMFPMPNGYSNPFNSSDLRNYRTFSSSGQDSYRLDMRFDYRLSQNDNVYVNISRSHGMDNNGGGLIPELTRNIEDSSHLLTVNYARVFTPSLTNEFVFATGKGKMYNVNADVRSVMSQPDTLRNKYFKNLGEEGKDFGYYLMAIDGHSWPGVGYEEVFMSSNPTLQFSDNVSWVKGSHSMKFGFNFFNKKEFDWDYVRSVRFNNVFTHAGSVDSSRGGDAMASFLLGLPSEINQRYQFSGGDPNLDFAYPYWGFFAEDKWQLTPKLTLSLGVRYDLAVPLYSPGKYGSAYVDTTVPDWELVIPGRASGTPQHYVPADKNNIAPRISLAYRLREGLVIRASYGVFYQAGMSMLGSVMGNAFGSVPGYVGDFYDNARFGVHDDIPYLTFSDIFPQQSTVPLGLYPVSTGVGRGNFDYPASVQVSDKDSGTVPYYQRYMLEIQKSLKPGTVFSVSYLGGRGTKLPYLWNMNAPDYSTGWASEDDFNDARPNNSGNFGDVNILRHGLNAFYNSATVKIEGRLTQNLQLVSHYTFSKTVADRSPFTTEEIWFDTNSWQWNRSLGRGEAQFSHPHRFVTALSYQTPWGASKGKLFKTLLWGWNFNAITTFESGDALTAYNGVTSARDWEPDMPNISGNPNLPRGERTPERYFNTSLFSAPLQDVKGTAGVGIIRGPGLNNWDLSFGKTFQHSERLKVQFRAELFNAFNHSQWSGLETEYSDSPDSSFGQITSAREPRVVQLGLRIMF
jgi:hypothetical protein